MKYVLQNKAIKTLALGMLLSFATTAWAQKAPTIGGRYSCTGQIISEDLEYNTREVEDVQNQKLTIEKHDQGFSIFGFENEDLVELFLGEEDTNKLPCVNSQRVVGDFRIKIKCNQKRISIAAVSSSGATSKMSFTLKDSDQLFYSVDVKSIYENTRARIIANCKLDSEASSQ